MTGRLAQLGARRVPRGPAVVAVAVAALIGAGGCGGGEAAHERSHPPSASPSLAPFSPFSPPSPAEPPLTPSSVPLVAAESVTMTVPVSGPIAVPPHPYAPEPVVEIGSIEIPRLGLTSRLFDGVTLHNIDRGPSHWPGSAMPGQPGNAVVAGHRATHSQPFRHLDDLVAGDPVVFTVGGVRSTYRVTGSRVVAPDDTWIADQTAAPTATLFACHPPGSVSQRYVVHLALV